MQVPIDVRYHDFIPSDSLKRLVQRRTNKLERLYRTIISCRVNVERPVRAHRVGNEFHVSVWVTVPGHDLVVHQKDQDVSANEDPRVTINRAFARLYRQLDTYAQRRRKQVKRHELAR